MFLKRVFGGRVATLKVTSAAKALFLNGKTTVRQLLVCNIPNFARLFVMTSASICACNPTKQRFLWLLPLQNDL